MLCRLQELRKTVAGLYAAAVENNPDDVDGEVTLLGEIDMMLDIILKVGPEERMTKIRRLVPKIREGLSIPKD